MIELSQFCSIWQHDLSMGSPDEGEDITIPKL